MSQQLVNQAPLSVLLAEDNVVNQRVASALLATIGCQVTICNNGREAVQAVIDGDYDLVLMDIQMPVLDGLAATMEIRQLGDPVKARIPILAISANSRAEDVARYRAGGIDDILAKPLRLDKLQHLLANHVEVRKPNAEAALSAAPIDDLLDHTQIAALREALTPQKLTELYAIARQSLLQSSAALKAGWQQDNRTEIKAAAHRLSGVARNFGCLALGRCAARIEDAVVNGNSCRDAADGFDALLTASLAQFPDNP